MSESATRAVAGKWGPIAFAVAPMINSEMLRAVSDDLFKMTASVHAAMTDKFRQWKHSKNECPALQDMLWNEYRELNREYNVLCGWQDLINAAHIFTQDGCQSHYLDGITEIGEVDIPNPNGIVYGYAPGCFY